MAYNETDELKVYSVSISDTVIAKLEDIEQYITEKYSSEAGKKRVFDIFDSLEGLKIFPHAGFNADEKFGVKIDHRYETRGVTLKKDYIALYIINEAKSEVVVTDLLPTRTDYLKLFK